MQVQVVGRLVEQQDVGPGEQQRGEAQQHGLAARDLADGPVQADAAEPELVQGGPGPLLDVPVVGEGGEVLLGRVARLDGVQGGPLRVDAEDLVDPARGVQDEVLRQVAEFARDPDRAGGGRQLAREQLEERGLAGAVEPDEPGAAGADHEPEVVEDLRAVRPGEGERGTGEEGGVMRHEGLRLRERGRDGMQRVETPGRGQRENGSYAEVENGTRGTGARAARCLATSDEQRPSPIG